MAPCGRVQTYSPGLVTSAPLRRLRVQPLRIPHLPTRIRFPRDISSRGLDVSPVPPDTATSRSPGRERHRGSDVSTGAGCSPSAGDRPKAAGKAPKRWKLAPGRDVSRSGGSNVSMAGRRCGGARCSTCWSGKRDNKAAGKAHAQAPRSTGRRRASGSRQVPGLWCGAAERTGAGSHVGTASHNWPRARTCLCAEGRSARVNTRPENW